ncbi:hypothetical protein [Teredinibacter turnerae]|uniref:hypothetical protein n=1 Tax=Teredinibacter turnerae TaxID=2426 RepID=UPI0030CE2517
MIFIRRFLLLCSVLAASCCELAPAVETTGAVHARAQRMETCVVNGKSYRARKCPGSGSSSSSSSSGGAVPAGVHAALRVASRGVTIPGVSPETIMFVFDDSTCSTCAAPNGDTDQKAVAYSGAMKFHIDFGDFDSGNWAALAAVAAYEGVPISSIPGYSKRYQESYAPRAVHTFYCHGATDPNWSAQDGLCVFNVGLRAQNAAGVHDDTFLKIKIMAQADFYSATNTICVSPAGQFDDCPDGAVQQAAVPAQGGYDGKRVLLHAGEMHGYIKTDHASKNITIDRYGEGPNPFVPYVIIGSDSIDKNSEALGLPMIAKNADGELTQGWAYNVTVTNLFVGTIGGPESGTIINFHNNDLDWSYPRSMLLPGADEPTVIPPLDGYGSVKFTGQASRCVAELPLNNLDCNNVPYPASIHITDSVVKSSLDLLTLDANGNIIGNELPTINVGAFHGSSCVNCVISGVEMGTSREHNIRQMGSWGLVISHSWVRGSHIGGSGAKAKATLRMTGTSSDEEKGMHDKNANPDDFASGGMRRKEGIPSPGDPNKAWPVGDYVPRYAVVALNYINDHDQDPRSVAGQFNGMDKYYLYSGYYENTYLTDPATVAAQVAMMGMSGKYIYAVENNVPSEYSVPTSATSAVLEGLSDPGTSAFISSASLMRWPLDEGRPGRFVRPSFSVSAPGSD